MGDAIAMTVRFLVGRLDGLMAGLYVSHSISDLVGTLQGKVLGVRSGEVDDVVVAFLGDSKGRSYNMIGWRLALDFILCFCGYFSQSRGQSISNGICGRHTRT